LHDTRIINSRSNYPECRTAVSGARIIEVRRVSKIEYFAAQLEAYRNALCLLCPELNPRDVKASLTFVRADEAAGM